MKRIIFSALAAAAIVGLPSCSEENEPVIEPGDGVSITLRIPAGMNTRAGSFGDQTKVVLNNLQWTVFEVGENGSLESVYSDQKLNAFASGNDTETVNLQLAKGKKYQVAFFADNSENNFITFNNGNVEVNYMNAASNSELEDAFIGKSKEISVNGAYSETIVLSRPYAQLNWGTDDLDAPALQNILPSMSFEVSVSKGLFTGMNIISGEVSGEVTEVVSFPAVASQNLPDNDFPVASEDAAKPYKLLCMNYLLTGDGTIDCSLKFSESNLTPVNVSNAPVKANFRTNIYGSLITSPANFEITVNRDFLDNINIPQEAMPVIDKAAKTMTVSTPTQLVSLSTLCNTKNGEYSTLKGWTVLLANDIDMSGIDFTPLGTTGTYFGGTFDGQNHTVSNLSVNVAEGAGLIGHLQGVVQNVNFEKAEIVSHHWAGVVAGYCTDNAGGRIYNINVDNSSVSITPEKINGYWDNGDKAGGIIGYMAQSGDSGVNMNTIENCSVSNTTVSGYRDIGGICGALDRPAVNCSVENVAITTKSDVMLIPGYNGGAIFGRNLGNAKAENCTITNVTVNEKPV